MSRFRTVELYGFRGFRVQGFGVQGLGYRFAMTRASKSCNGHAIMLPISGLMLVVYVIASASTTSSMLAFTCIDRIRKSESTCSCAKCNRKLAFCKWNRWKKVHAPLPLGKIAQAEEATNSAKDQKAHSVDWAVFSSPKTFKDLGMH